MRAPIVRTKTLTGRQHWMLRRLWSMGSQPASIDMLAFEYAQTFGSTPGRGRQIVTALEELGVCCSWRSQRRGPVVVITGRGKRCLRAGSVIVTRAK